MKTVKLAILGAGNIHASIPVIASLASFFGERTLEIRLYDADSERLDLVDRFARFAFATGHAFHSLSATTDAAEAILDADRAILQVDSNCAAKGMRLGASTDVDIQTQRVRKHLRKILEKASPQTKFLSLEPSTIKIPLESYFQIDWPEAEGESDGSPLQILRWISSDDPLFDLLKKFEHSPLKEWINEPESGTLISK